MFGTTQKIAACGTSIILVAFQRNILHRHLSDTVRITGAFNVYCEIYDVITHGDYLLLWIYQVNYTTKQQQSQQKGEFMVNQEKIKELLGEKGIEQKALAAQVGISEAMMSFIVNGLREPSLTVLSRIAKVLGVPVAELIIEE